MPLSRLIAGPLVLALAVVACASPEAPEGPLSPTRPGAGGKADDATRDAVAAIDAWNAGLSDADRAAKYCKMAASPFAFYRGTNHLFWSDFAGDARLTEFSSDRTKTWIQGDLHAYNFGAFDNDRGDVVYSLNDFDESLVADYQYDVWRMAISLVLIARSNGDLSTGKQEDVVDAFSEAYLDTVAGYRGNDDETRVQFTEKTTGGDLEDFLDDVAKDNSRRKALDKWTRVDDGMRVFDVSLDKLGELAADEADELRRAVAAYGDTLSGRIDYDPSHFRVKSVARRLLAGTGSLGTPRYYVLIEGPSADDDDDRILDVKLQSSPTAYVFLGAGARGAYDAAFTNHARRHAIATKALLDNVDDYLGWLRLADGDYSVRERSVYKEAFPTETLDTRGAFSDMSGYWGAVLATTHSRADEDFDADYVSYSVDKQIDVVTDHHHAAFRALVRQVAFGYADRVVADWQDFVSGLDLSCP